MIPFPVIPTLETRVYDVEDDVASITCRALPRVPQRCREPSVVRVSVIRNLLAVDPLAGAYI